MPVKRIRDVFAHRARRQTSRTLRSERVPLPPPDGSGGLKRRCSPEFCLHPPSSVLVTQTVRAPERSHPPVSGQRPRASMSAPRQAGALPAGPSSQDPVPPGTTFQTRPPSAQRPPLWSRRPPGPPALRPRPARPLPVRLPPPVCGVRRASPSPGPPPRSPQTLLHTSARVTVRRADVVTGRSFFSVSAPSICRKVQCLRTGHAGSRPASVCHPPDPPARSAASPVCALVLHLQRPPRENHRGQPSTPCSPPQPSRWGVSLSSGALIMASAALRPCALSRGCRQPRTPGLGLARSGVPTSLCPGRPGQWLCERESGGSLWEQTTSSFPVASLGPAQGLAILGAQETLAEGTEMCRHEQNEPRGGEGPGTA